MLQQLFSWTEANTAILIQMAKQGQSARTVAERIGCTRNAALGKALRIGISFRNGRGGAAAHRPGSAKRPASAEPHQRAPKTKWTTERIDEAAVLWKAGLTGNEIGERMGCTMAAFMFLAGNHRDKFPPRGSGNGKRQVAATLPEKTFAFDSAPFLLPEFPSIRFADLEPQHCRWPVSNDHGADMLCCGAQRLKGSYCGVHAVVARGRGTEGERKAVSVGRNW